MTVRFGDKPAVSLMLKMSVGTTVLVDEGERHQFLFRHRKSDVKFSQDEFQFAGIAHDGKVTVFPYFQQQWR